MFISGIASNGAYICGRHDLVELCAERLNVPGQGKEVGPSGNANKMFLLGLYLAPMVVLSALKTAILLSYAMEKIGYEVNFESFCKFLENYINKKDNMTDEEKRAELKILLPLSELFDINLRAELEKYITYIDKKKPVEEHDKIFKMFCIYNLLPNNNVELYNKIKQICEENHIDYNETQKQALMYVEEIKLTAEKLGYETDLDSTNRLMEYYLDHKKEMTDQEKITYLKVLFHLCEVYEIDLRQEIINNNKNQKEELTLESLKKLLNNPLDNEEMLIDLLRQRLNFNSFNVYSLYCIMDCI